MGMQDRYFLRMGSSAHRAARKQQNCTDRVGLVYESLAVSGELTMS